jgi:hypothetical protein
MWQGRHGGGSLAAQGNYMPDGSDIEFDLAFFRALASVRTEEEVQQLAEQIGL